MTPRCDRHRVCRGVVERPAAPGQSAPRPARHPPAAADGPVEPPRIDPGLEGLSAPERAAEVLRYSLLGAERAISPDGALRRWLKAVLRVGLFAAIPILVLLPLALLLLHGIAACVRRLQETALQSVPSGLATCLVLLAVLAMLRLSGAGRR